MTAWHGRSKHGRFGTSSGREGGPGRGKSNVFLSDLSEERVGVPRSCRSLGGGSVGEPWPTDLDENPKRRSQGC